MDIVCLLSVGQGIESENQDDMMQVYRTLVWPHLEYCVQFWSTPYQKDVEALEGGSLEDIVLK